MSALGIEEERAAERVAPAEPAASAVRAVVGSWGGRIGLALVGICLLIFAVGPLVAPHDPVATGVGVPGSGPSAGLPFGTDALGRDVLSRFLNGGSDVILPPLAAIAIAFLTGGTLGLVAGFRGGWFDTVAMRCLDVLLAFPALVLALVVVARFGGGTLVMIIVVAAVFAPRIAVVLRGAARAVRQREYVRAAELRGDPVLAIVGREILPNVAATALVEFGIRLTYAVLFVATMSVLGFGAQPPSSNWGAMVADARQVISLNPLAAVVPALGIAILVVGVNLISDALASHFSRETEAAR